MCKGQQMQYRADNKIQNMMLIYNVNIGDLDWVQGSRKHKSTKYVKSLYMVYVNINLLVQVAVYVSIV